MEAGVRAGHAVREGQGHSLNKHRLLAAAFSGTHLLRFGEKILGDKVMYVKVNIHTLHASMSKGGSYTASSCVRARGVWVTLEGKEGE